jgi:hypothetical protein
MNARWVRVVGVLSLVVLGLVLAGCGSVTNPVAPAAQVDNGLQPPGRQGEIAPPSVPGTPPAPSAGGFRSGSDPGPVRGE